MMLVSVRPLVPVFSWLLPPSSTSSLLPSEGDKDGGQGGSFTQSLKKSFPITFFFSSRSFSSVSLSTSFTTVGRPVQTLQFRLAANSSHLKLDASRQNVKGLGYLHGPPVGRPAPGASRRGRGHTAAAAPSLWAEHHRVVRRWRMNSGEVRSRLKYYLSAHGRFCGQLP